jgi:hypothetical protein
MNRYHYPVGTVRYFRLTGGEPRCNRPPAGWDAIADLTDRHPLTGKEFKTSQWWITETKVSE